MLALAGSGDPSSHSAKSTKRFRHRNQSGEEVALSNAEANLFGNRWGKLYERYKRNWIPIGDSCGRIRWQEFFPPIAGRNRVSHAICIPSVHISSMAGKPPVERGTSLHQDLAKWIEVVPRATTILMAASRCAAKFQACPLGTTSTPWAISPARSRARDDGSGHWIHQLVTVGPRQVQLTLRCPKAKAASDWRSSNCSYTCRAVLNSPKKSQASATNSNQAAEGSSSASNHREKGCRVSSSVLRVARFWIQRPQSAANGWP